MIFSGGDVEVVNTVSHIETPVTNGHINHEPLAFGPIEESSSRSFPEA